MQRQDTKNITMFAQPCCSLWCDKILLVHLLEVSHHFLINLICGCYLLGSIWNGQSR